MTEAEKLINGLKTNDCKRCGTPNQELDQASLGMILRLVREKKGLLLKDVAEKLGVSAPYVCDLETARRDWNKDLVTRYLAACNGHKKGM